MCKSIIDIRADHIRTKSQEKVWGVKMTLTDHQFYDQQCLDGQPGYCGTLVDIKWQLTMMRKKHTDNVLQKSREKLQVPYYCYLVDLQMMDIKNVICCHR